MASHLTRIKGFFAPPIFPDDEDKTRTARALNTLLVTIMLFLVFAGGILVPFVFVEKLPSLGLILGLFGAMIAAHWQIRQGHVRFASAIWVSATWIAFTILVSLAGGMTSITVVFYVTGTVIAGLLLGARAALVYTLVCSLVGLGMLILESSDRPLPRLFPVPALVGWAIMTFALLLTTAILNHVLRGLSDALALARQQIEERKRSEEALRKSEERYRLMTDSVTDVIWVVDMNFGFTYVSPSVERLRGYSAEEAMAQSLADALTPASLVRATKILEDERKNITRGVVQPRTVEFEFKCKDGSTVETESNISVLYDENKIPTAILGSTRGIPERKQVERELHRRAEELTALQATVLDITTPHDLPALLQTIVERAARLLDTHSGGMYLCDLDRREARCVVSYNTPKDYTGTVLKYGEGAAGVVAETGEPLVIDDYRAWARRAAVYEEEQPFMAVLSAPMLWRGQVTGVIHVLHSQEHRLFTPADLELLTLFANHAAVAIENARLYEQAREEIEERKQAQEGLRESEERFRRLAENAQDLIYRYRFIPDPGLEYVSPAATDITGYTPEEHYADPELGLKITHPDDRLQLEKYFQEEGGIFGRPITVRWVKKDGTLIWIEQRNVPIYDEAGTLVAMEGIARDITEQKRAEEALRFTQFAIDRTSDAAFWMGSDARFMYVNDAACHSLGYSREELLTMTVHDIDPGFPPEIWQDHWRDVKERGSFVTESHHRAKDGRVFPVDITVNFVEFEGKEYNCAFAHDITERKQAEQERERLLAQIREQAQRMQHILNTVPEGVILMDPVGQVVLANPLGEKNLVILAGARVGDTLTHLGDHPLAKLLTSPPRGLWHEVAADGRSFQVIARPIENGPTPAGWVMVIRDVTQQREIEKRIQQQERLAAVGQLAAGIAHDFNNIMATVVLYAQMTARMEGLPATVRERMETIHQQTEHATNLIQQILDFSRRAVLERRPLDLVPLLKEHVRLLRRTLPESVEIALECKLDERDALFTVNADPTRMQQMVTNLALNAREAMPQGGELRIGLERIEVKPGESPLLPEMKPGEWARVTVSDTGTGIPPDVFPHIFEPFFTTRAPLGSGLGLAQVHGIVGQHGGRIDVDTEVGIGTTFTIYLPMHPSEPSPVRSREELSALPTGQGETILVVEDDAVVRRALADTLELLNYQVLEVSNGQEALETLQQRKGEVALVLSDVVMPHMGGIALLHALRERGLAVPVVMVTGHPIQREMEELRTQEMIDWLPKPPKLDQLAEVVARVLGRD